MKYSATIIQEVASARLYIFALPDGVEIEEFEFFTVLPDFLPTTLLFEAWYTTLQQGIDWRAGYYNHNPTYQEPKGGTATYFFNVGPYRINFAMFDSARRQLPESYQKHLLDVAERKAQLRLEVAFALWKKFTERMGE